MPVDKNQLNSYLDELGLTPEERSVFETTLLKDENRATKFVGQRLRQDDYTRKTQELANQRQTIEAETNAKVVEYAQQLAAAEEQRASILKQLEDKDISIATANARLNKVKTLYNLGDDDIPPVTVADVKPAANSQPIDIDAKINQKFEVMQTNFLQKVLPELTSILDVGVIESDIYSEHRELTGKPLTRQERLELLKKSRDEKVSLEQAWDSKYGISNLRKEKEFETRFAAKKQEWEDQQKSLATQQSIESVSGKGRQPANISPIMGRQFKNRANESEALIDSRNQPTQNQPQPKLSGAERATAKFIERSQSGQLGKPIEIKRSA